MKNTLVVVDVESDGPCPPLYSMVSFGAVVVEPALDRTFYGQTAPIEDQLSKSFDPAALAVVGVTHEQHLAYPPPAGVIDDFYRWLRGLGADRLTFVSDNPAFDWQWINYYFWNLGALHPSGASANPFGHSARRIGDLWAGMRGKFNDHTSWKDLRKTRHTHNPVDDARGNAEALLEIMRRMQEGR